MIIASIEGEYRRYKELAWKAMRQLSDAELMEARSEADNSIAVIYRHIAGNLRSRFTDFLSTDGEKPWREREMEFQGPALTRPELEQLWEEGWRTLEGTLSNLQDEQLGLTVTIRKQRLTVAEALHRSLAHVASHVGQIIFIAKQVRGSAWEYLSIPPGKSALYNERPASERTPRSSRG